MITFLTNISQLDSIHDVMFLSSHGKLLFCNRQKNPQLVSRKIGHWNQVIASFEKPTSADFLFKNGQYYLCLTDAGYLIIGMSDNIRLKKIKMACTNVQGKLAHPVTRKKVLLKMLSEVNDTLKPHIIEELVTLADKDIALVLLKLLKKEAQFNPKTKDRLLLAICETLGSCSFFEAVEPLKKFVEMYTAKEDTVNNNISQAVQISIKQLEFAFPNPTTTPTPTITPETKNPQKQGKSQTKPIKIVQKARNLPQADQINKLLETDKKDEAVSLIMQLIETAAQKQQFDSADKLRDWLIEVDSMSLMKIIRAAEIIDEAKKAAISNDYFSTWDKMSKILSSEEFSSLYHVMSKKNYANGEMIAKQGEFLATLFFVKSGRVQLYGVSQGREVPLKVLGQGEIIGSESFFDISVWTINVKSNGADLLLLPRTKLQQMEGNFPGFTSKLHDYCASSLAPDAIFKKSSRSRRTFERKQISGKATVVLLDKNNAKTSIGAKGDLLDISKGGISLSSRFTKKVNADAFFGQKIEISIFPHGATTSLIRNGVVLAVQGHDLIGNEYSLHVEFDSLLNNSELQKLLMVER